MSVMKIPRHLHSPLLSDLVSFSESPVSRIGSLSHFHSASNATANATANATTNGPTEVRATASNTKSPFIAQGDKMYNHNNALRIDWVIRKIQNLKFRFGSDPRLHQSQRKKVVILGTGWAAMNFMTRLNVAKYDVSIISPRNYFTFTPLLPSVCAGTLSPRSCLEPVRNKMLRGGKKVMNFYEGWATSVDMSNVR